ncbi:MAG: IS200/IS605 family transposase [Candidatus Babeliales bacterium]
MASHVHSCLYYHFVWTTKNRLPFIKKDIKIILYNFIGSLIESRNWHLLAIGGSIDHIHILIKKSSKYEISDVACKIKSYSSKFIREKFNENFSWQKGYAVFTIDKFSLKKIKNYINNQEIRHSKQSFEEEYESLLYFYECEFEEDGLVK